MISVLEFLSCNKDDINTLAKQFGFKDVLVLFRGLYAPMTFTLVVDVDKSGGGNRHYVSILEAKIMEKYRIDTEVIINEHISAPPLRSSIDTMSVPIEINIKEAVKKLNISLDGLYYRDLQLPINHLKRKLDLVEFALNRVRASQSNSALFHHNNTNDWDSRKNELRNNNQTRDAKPTKS